MRRLSRRHFAGSVGAGLLLAPFINMATAPARAGRRPPVEAGPAVLHDGDEAVAVDADRDLGREHHHLERDDAAAVGGEGERRARRGDAQRQPEQRPRRVRQPDRPGLRLLRPGRHQDLRRSVHRQEAGGRGGINRPIASLLLGANTSDNGGISQFYGGATGGNLPTIGSPLSAFNTVFGAALPPGMSASALLARRKSILDLVKAETTTLKGSLGNNEKAKLDVHLDSIRQLENKLNAAMPTGNACTKPDAPGADSTMQYMGSLDALRGQRRSPEHHRQRLRLRHHARGVPRVRQRPEVHGQRAAACPTTISTAASSTAARRATSPTW